jgi:hypothetical protein
MADKFEGFREEFNEIMDKAMSCDSEQCEQDEGLNDDDYPDYIIELKTKMLSPDKCGIYFSKKDIRNIAKECGENISLKQRDRMMDDLLRSIFDLEEMERVFDVIRGYIDLRITYYDELSAAYDKSEPFLAEYKPKALALRKSLDRIIKESQGQVLKP